MGFLRDLLRGAPPPPEWLVITEPGAPRGLFHVASRTSEAVLLEGGGVRVQYAPRDLPAATRPVLTRAEAEARLAELLVPSAPDPRHRHEQFIQLIKTVSRGSDAEVVALLRGRYAQAWTPSFGDKKALDQLEQRILPELAHVLERPEDTLRAEIRAPHAIASAQGEAPQEAPWAGVGSDEAVPTLEGLEAIGTLSWSGSIAIGPRLDRAGEPNAGVARVPIVEGTWHAWLELDPEDEEAPCALVLLRAGEEKAWPHAAWDEVDSTRPWAVAPAAPLQVIEEASLDVERVMDAARYLGGTQTYWEKAVSVALLDGLPPRVAISVPRGARGPYRALSISLREDDA